MNRICTILAALGLTLVALPAAAQGTPTPKLLGVTGNWEAFTLDGSAGKVCYAVSVPRSIEPRNVSRDPIFFIISDWATRSVKNEFEVVPGYKYQDGSTVTAQIGTEKFAFMTQNDATSGGAWIKSLADEPRLLSAMQRGSQMVVTGTSSRGTVTRDTFSLVGFSAAIASIHKACNM